MKYSLLAIEDINADEMDFSVAVLASLGGGHFNDLARTALQHDESVLAESRALHGEGGRGTGVPGLEVGVLDVAHCAVVSVLESTTVRSDLLEITINFSFRFKQLIHPTQTYKGVVSSDCKLAEHNMATIILYR